MQKKWFLVIFSIIILGACQTQTTQDQGETTSKDTTAQNAGLSLKGNTVWNADTQSAKIYWIGRKMVGQHEGFVLIKEGTLYFTDDALTGGTFVIDMQSITNTDQEGEDKQKLEKHLKSEDFFAVDKYPEAVFTLVKGTPAKDKPGEYNVVGKLTMRGVTKEISFPAKITKENNRLHITATFEINRQDWGVKYKGMKDNLIKDEVTLRLDIYADAAENAVPVAE